MGLGKYSNYGQIFVKRISSSSSLACPVIWGRFVNFFLYMIITTRFQIAVHIKSVLVKMSAKQKT